VKNSSAGRRIARELNVRKQNVRKLKHTVNKVSSLRDFARRSGERNKAVVIISRKLKHTVNKVPSLRDFARHSGERNNLAVFIVFLFVYKNFLFLVEMWRAASCREAMHCVSNAGREKG
jgi:hypothetical protein